MKQLICGRLGSLVAIGRVTGWERMCLAEGTGFSCLGGSGISERRGLDVDVKKLLSENGCSECFRVDSKCFSARYIDIADCSNFTRFKNGIVVLEKQPFAFMRLKLVNGFAWIKGLLQ